MAHYAGRDWTRAELQAYVGHMRQLAGITPFAYTDGRARGTRGYHVYTGSGLAFDVLADRALDIDAVQFRGRALAWSSANGPVHPAYYEPDGLGWLRSFAGGLVTTCGLDQFGSPADDKGESFGIHGRVGNLPAEGVSYRTWWEKDEYYLEVSGQVRQARLFGENLLLSRRITTQLGSDTITITDVVTNEGFTTQPHMLLYHCNLGFPLLGPDAELKINVAETLPRDDTAAAGLAHWHRFDVPTPGYAEQVFRHSVIPDADGDTVVILRNPSSGLALTLAYSHATLPHLFQWKQCGQGAYVLGLEPANSSAIEGRSVARSRDDLPHLDPGESRTYSLRFTVSDITT